jgi:hypothetical protein
LSYLEINRLKHEVAEDVRFAVELMEEVYGAKRGLQLAIRMAHESHMTSPGMGTLKW